MKFDKVWTSPNDYVIIQDDGVNRFVCEDIKKYQDWCAEGNTPTDIPYIVEIPAVPEPIKVENKQVDVLNRTKSIARNLFNRLSRGVKG
jgi:hypothetical protein